MLNTRGYFVKVDCDNLVIKAIITVLVAFKIIAGMM